MLKKLVTGQLSLPMTFWGWGIGGGFLLGLCIQTNNAAMVPLVFFLKIALLGAVLSGITFILRRKITIWGILAFSVVLIEVIIHIVLTIGLYSLLYK